MANREALIDLSEMEYGQLQHNQLQTLYIDKIAFTRNWKIFTSVLFLIALISIFLSALSLYKLSQNEHSSASVSYTPHVAYMKLYVKSYDVGKGGVIPISSSDIDHTVYEKYFHLDKELNQINLTFYDSYDRFRNPLDTKYKMYIETDVSFQLQDAANPRYSFYYALYWRNSYWPEWREVSDSIGYIDSSKTPTTRVSRGCVNGQGEDRGNIQLKLMPLTEVAPYNIKRIVEGQSFIRSDFFTPEVRISSTM